jgi:hypothetical protein
MHFVVAGTEEATAAVEYFNGFHDGFIRRLSLTSHDTFEDRDTHVITGLLDLEILFAHSNYREGFPPFDQLVEARFAGVRDLRMNFTGLPADWPIINFHLECDSSPTSTGRSWLRARLIQARLVDNSRWEHVEAVTFSFHSAEFREVGAA